MITIQDCIEKWEDGCVIKIDNGQITIEKAPTGRQTK